jgi:hypothetical protein
MFVMAARYGRAGRSLAEPTARRVTDVPLAFGSAGARSLPAPGTAAPTIGVHSHQHAIAVSPDGPQHPGKFLRDHHKPGNRQQHQAFLDEVEGTPLQKNITDWFKTLPLWLDLPGLRVVHAKCLK